VDHIDAGWVQAYRLRANLWQREGGKSYMLILDNLVLFCIMFIFVNLLLYKDGFILNFFLRVIEVCGSLNCCGGLLHVVTGLIG